MSNREITFTILEAFDEILYRNEHFCGNMIRLQKKQQYQELYDILTELMEKSSFVKNLSGTDLSERQRNSHARMDVSGTVFFDREELDLFEQAIGLADHFTMAVVGENIRCSFGVQDVWAE